MTNPRCAAGDNVSSPFAGNGLSARKIATRLATKAAPMPSCTALCTSRKDDAPPRMSHRDTMAGFIFGGWERHAGHRLDPDEMIPDLLDAGHVFSGYDQTRTFAIIRDHAMQFGHAGVDDHINARRPILFPDRGKNL